MLPNAAISVITIIGLAFSYALTGAFVVETIFRIPGLGQAAIGALFARDYRWSRQSASSTRPSSSASTFWSTSATLSIPGSGIDDDRASAVAPGVLAPVARPVERRGRLLRILGRDRTTMVAA